MKNFSNLENRIVLIVDDNELNHLIISKILQKAGIKTVSSYNGPSAIKKLEDGLTPDLILMDLEMPLMNGLEVCEFIRKQLNSTVPIIINSGLASTTQKYKLSLIGIKEYLLKPYTIEDILSKIDKNISAAEVHINTSGVFKRA